MAEGRSNQGIVDRLYLSPKTIETHVSRILHKLDIRDQPDDHRRILATAMGRLRGKLKYRPVVFELMPAEFTLLQLQRSVEALAGRLVHKQNFRRLMEQQQLVEETGAIAADTVGRPAKLFRFRHGVLAERAVAGTKLPLSRT